MSGPARLRMPPEWAPHRATWVAYPHLEHEWGDAFEPARAEWLGLVRALATVGAESVHILCPESARAELRAALHDLAGIRLIALPYGDGWTRDTFPIGLVAGHRRAFARFAFDGWGGKYPMPGDAELGDRVAPYLRGGLARDPHVIEGGALEISADATLLTTRGAILDPVRNPGWTEAEATETLERMLGAQHVVWLDGALRNDHTDGHIDTLARFTPRGDVLCMASCGAGDPHREAHEEIRRGLEAAVDARGAPLRVHTIPAPEVILDAEGAPLPASYANYYVANAAVLVPAYGVVTDEAARAAIAEHFPAREVVSVAARALLSGGGSLHCLTHEEPA